MDIAALKAVSGRLQQRALARLSLKSPPNRIAREDAALDQEAAASILSLIARLEALEAELEWYGEQARLARLIHSEGDSGRHALAGDGGKRARAALEPVQS